MNSENIAQSNIWTLCHNGLKLTWLSAVWCGLFIFFSIHSLILSAVFIVFLFWFFCLCFKQCLLLLLLNLYCFCKRKQKSEKTQTKQKHTILLLLRWLWFAIFSGILSKTSSSASTSPSGFHRLAPPGTLLIRTQPESKRRTGRKA